MKLTCLVLGLALVGQTWSEPIIGGIVNGVANMIPTKFGDLPMPGKDVKILGCFNDNVIFRAIGGKMTSYKTEEVVKKCYERAKAIKAKVFGVQFGTACFTNKNADKEYAKYGRALLGGCTNGKGGPSMNDVYEISYGVTVAKPKPLIVATAPRVTKAPLRTIKHIDPKDPLKVAYVVKEGFCYHKCGKKYGPCEDYCGENNFCCKKGEPGCEDELRDMAPKGSRCVAWRVPECVKQDRNFAGNNVGKVTKQDSWEKCSQACDKEPACKAFSFVRNNYKVAKNRGNCHFKNKNFGNKIQNLKGVFSAKRGCGTKYTGVNGPGLIQTRPPTILPPTRRPTRPPTPHDFSYANYKNKKCRTAHKAKGCFATSQRFKRGKLLVYWRHDIEWAKNRIGSFASSLACACAEAAQKNGYRYYGIHYYGECWGLRKHYISLDRQGDCVLADGLYKNKCTGDINKRYSHDCLANESYFTYTTDL